MIDDLTLEMTIITEWLREGEAGESTDASTTSTGIDSTSAIAGQGDDGSKSVSHGYDSDDTEEVGEVAVVGGGGNSGMMNGILQMGDNTASRSTHTSSPTATSTPTKGTPLSSTISQQDKLRLDIDSESESDIDDWPEDDFDDLMDTLIMQGDDIPEGIIDDDEFERHINNMVKKSSATSSTLTVTNTAEKPKKPKKVSSSVPDLNRQPIPPPPAEPVYIPLYYDDDDDAVIEFVGARGSSLTPMDYERLLDSN